MSASRLDVKIVGEGRHLVLLHSLLSDRTSYEPLADRIAGERRLVMVNLPGFGRAPPGGSALSDYAHAVAAVFDDLALPPETDVLGNGLGGFVALALASRHGDRFARLVLVGSAIAFPEAGRATFRALADKVDKNGMGAVADAAMRRMFPEPFIAANPEVVAGARRCSGGSIRRSSPRPAGCSPRSTSAPSSRASATRPSLWSAPRTRRRRPPSGRHSRSASRTPR